MKTETETKTQIVNAIKDNLFHQVCSRLFDFSFEVFDDYKDSKYFSPKDLTIVLSFDEYEFLRREVFNA